MDIDLTKALKTVIDYYETAMKDRTTYVNYYYEPNHIAKDALIKDGVITKYCIGSIFVGDEYKGHLFVSAPGAFDCSELLICKGKI